jgi:phosphatidylglycerophosphatase A
MALVLLIFAGACIRDGEAAEARFGKKDPGQVVADETAGQCLPLMFLPATAVAGWPAMLMTLPLAFVSFRIMDIVKPWPARQLQRVPGGWGILIDDLFAGVYALVVVQVVTRLGWIGP